MEYYGTYDYSSAYDNASSLANTTSSIAGGIMIFFIIIFIVS